MRLWLCWMMCCLCCLSWAKAADTPVKPRIHWIQLDFPPYYLKSSQDGRDESVALLLEHYLPGFEFRRLSVPASRLMRSLDDADGSNVCVLSLYKTPEREQRLLFSKHPATFGLPIELITRTELVERLAQDKIGDRYQLAQIVQKNPKGMGITASRSFGSSLDELLHDNRLTRLAGETALGSLSGMVSRGRLDYTLGYPDELVYIAGTQQLNNLVSLPLAETASFSLGYVGCNATEENQAMLAALDKQWSAIYQDAKYLPLLQRWLQPDAKLRVERVFDEYRHDRQIGQVEAPSKL